MIRDVKDEHWRLLHAYENYAIHDTIVEKWYPSNWLEITMKLSDGSISKFQLLNNVVSYPPLDTVDILDMSEEEWRTKYSKLMDLRRYYVGMVREDLAKHSGISATSVNKYFNGAYTPSLYNATKLARTMKASLSEFQVDRHIRLDFDEVNEELNTAVRDIGGLYPDIAENLKCWYPIINQHEMMLITESGEMFIFDMETRKLTLRVYNPRQYDTYISPTEWGNRFSHILRYKMYDYGISQSALSNMIGISQPIISRYVKGSSIPSLYTATKIAKVFNCSLTEFHI